MDKLTIRCTRCKKERSESEFPETKRWGRSKRCQACLSHVQSPTTCKRCLKSFPLEEFRIGQQGKRITYCARCADIRIAAHRDLALRMREKNKVTIALGEKICLRCRATKSLEEFKDKRGFVRRVCAPCREYMAQHADKQRAKWTPERRESKMEQALAIQRRVRDEVLAAYGGFCVCCGETTKEFLSIDHVDGNGSEHRRELRRQARAGEQSAYTFDRWLRNNGYPAGFQVLCHNCNQAKGFYGTCPHRKNPLLLVDSVGIGPLVVKHNGPARRVVQ